MDPLQVPLPEQFNLTEDEIKQVHAMLGNPSVQKYFKLLNMNAMIDLVANPIDTSEQEKVLLSKYKIYTGVQIVYTHVINNFGKKG